MRLNSIAYTEDGQMYAVELNVHELEPLGRIFSDDATLVKVDLTFNDGSRLTYERM